MKTPTPAPKIKSTPGSTLAFSPTKVAIIGTGAVGTATAFACIMRKVAPELMLYDINTSRAHGQVLDLEDASSFLGSSSLSSCSYAQDTPRFSSTTKTPQDCGQADIIVVAAGNPQAPGESRDNLLYHNQLILKDILTKISPIKPTAIMIMVTNPVNLMTALAQKLSGLPPNQVIGTGTILDTARLRTAIKKALQHHQQLEEGYAENESGFIESSIHANVIGDHGDKQVALWSTATVGGYPLTSFNAFKLLNTQIEVAKSSAAKVYEIIEHKTASSFGIAVIIAEIIDTIASNKKAVLPLSVYSKRYDVCLALPVVLSANGIGTIIYPQMNEREQAALDEYVRANRAICAPFFHPRGPKGIFQEEARL
ncbi:hypothetical protein BX616_008376 [Lobosporangium transversale]|uniref:L-lactate dehydrogenase n=1 Tax=Lobosporangium transversale TaxID=64571 RepID=A0A1Y2G9K2_9FUNG|nr:hypothetical protein BCR41DRAFT_341759 [Lobosporangium transversale]KAF9914407.1 hypothetical protein BX616_008376 [Lobosporangium transversale]ORZ04861.1 hypothetical protein BCR41DRAFT_341759 [Lobosporangium transversale]|eukprot:XP_021876798.1 hypothetical protein BCR41DRAFT_341759 [Lobosporangium transversale]